MSRIAHIITKLEQGGAQWNTLYTSIHQKNKGNHVDIITGPEIDQYLKEYSREHGLGVIVAEGLSNGMGISSLMSIFEIRRILIEGRYDIVHTHSSVAGIAGRLAARFAGVKHIIHTVHGWGLRPDMSWSVRKVYLILEKICARFSDAIIAVSYADIEKGLDCGIGKRERYFVARSGFDIKRFQKKIDIDKKKRELGLDKKKKIIGMNARFDKQKDPISFVRMAAIIQRNFEGVQFVVVGDGPMRKESEELAKKLGVDLKTLGYRTDYEEVIQTFDICVLISLWEGLPRVLPEAMAAGKPIVANSVDGVLEAVKDGINGYLINPGDFRHFAEKVLYLLNNPKIAHEMGGKGKELVKDFSLYKMLNDIDEVYVHIVKKKIR